MGWIERSVLRKPTAKPGVVLAEPSFSTKGLA